MAGKPKNLESTDDLRASIQHVDEVSARISRLLADLSAAKPTPGGEEAEQIPSGA